MPSAHSTVSQAAIPKTQRLVLVLGVWGTSVLMGCSAAVVRPVQEMSDSEAALRAAKEVQAQTLAPEFFREATEHFQKARDRYVMKDFSEALELANKARRYAELAEFEALKAGASRNETDMLEPIADPMARPPSNSDQDERPVTPYEYPAPQGTPARHLLNGSAGGGSSGQPSAGAPSTTGSRSE